jgi:hypothetical protein
MHKLFAAITDKLFELNVKPAKLCFLPSPYHHLQVNATHRRPKQMEI